jgi:hypothetical protein
VKDSSAIGREQVHFFKQSVGFERRLPHRENGWLANVNKSQAMPPIESLQQRYRSEAK